MTEYHSFCLSCPNDLDDLCSMCNPSKHHPVPIAYLNLSAPILSLELLQEASPSLISLPSSS